MPTGVRISLRPLRSGARSPSASVLLRFGGAGRPGCAGPRAAAPRRDCGARFAGFRASPPIEEHGVLFARSERHKHAGFGGYERAERSGAVALHVNQNWRGLLESALATRAAFLGVLGRVPMLDDGQRDLIGGGPSARPYCLRSAQFPGVRDPLSECCSWTGGLTRGRFQAQRSGRNHI